MRHRSLSAIAGTLLMLLSGLTGNAVIGPDIGGRADDDAAVIDGLLTGGTRNPAKASSASDPNVAYLRTGQCPNPAPGPLDTPICPAGVGPVLIATCPDGQLGIAPLWTRTRDATTQTGWTPWLLLARTGGCPGDPGFPTVTATDFQRLPLTASTINVQPPTGWTLANIPTIVYTSNAPQTLNTTVLGLDVTVLATPSTYTWDFDDRTTPVTTTDPGAPYPHATLTHTYRTAATHGVTLTTRWTGQFLVDGFATWLPITGTAQTRTTPTTLTSYAARSHLVADSG